MKTLLGYRLGLRSSRLPVPSTSVEVLVAAADAARDAGRAAEAAPLYEAALAVAPERRDLRIQFANMLKDAGNPQKAIVQYQIALAEQRDDADALLQLGRALRQAGRWAESVEAFKEARARDPNLYGAAIELLRGRAIGPDDPAYRPAPVLDRLAALQATAAQLRQLRTEIDSALARLPDLEMWAAVPPEHYGLLRTGLDLPLVPSDPSAETVSFAIFIDADAGDPMALHMLLEGLSRQPFAAWRLHAAAERQAQRDAVARANLRDPRVTLVDTGEQPDETAWRLHLPAGGFLHEAALGWLAFAAARHPEHAFFFDEEVGALDSYGRFVPERVRLASAADVDALLEADVAGAALLLPPASGNFHLFQDDIGTRVSLQLDLAEAGRLAHLPLPLLRRFARQPALGVEDAERRRYMAEAWLRRRTPNAAITPATPLAADCARRGVPPADRIGLVISSRDNPDDLSAFVESLIALARRPSALRFLLIDHAGTSPDTGACFARLAAQPGTEVLRLDEPFNWARFNNLGAAALAGAAEVLIFANDDLLMLTHGWDDIVLEALARPHVGAVGGRLIYPDDLIQHAGVVAGWGRAVNNDGRLRHVSEAGPNQRWHVTRTTAALIGAFLATHAENFAAVGGFDEFDLPIAFSDVDFCFKVRARGRRALYSPHLTLRHHESKTRGDDAADTDRQARYQRELAVMEQRWGKALRRDPSVHPFWRDVGEPFQLMSICGSQAVVDHLDLCAAADPWRLATPE